MTVVAHRTLVDTPECVQQMCDDANAQVGCHLEYAGRMDDGRHEVRASSTAALVGTPAQLFHAINAFTGGYVTARHEYRADGS